MNSSSAVYLLKRVTCFALVLAVVVLVGCVPKPRDVRVLPPSLEKKLLERLSYQSHAFSSLKGLARVKVQSDKQSTSGTQALFVQGPDLLRADTQNPFGFGGPVLQMATDGEVIELHIPGENRFLRGQASPQLLARITQLPFTVSDLVSLLLIKTPLIDTEKRRVDWDGESGKYRLRLQGQGVRQELLFDEQLRLYGSRYFEGDDLQLEVRYEKYPPEGQGYPHRLTLFMPSRNLKGTLEFSVVKTNVAIEPEKFQLSPPEGVVVEVLTENP